MLKIPEYGIKNNHLQIVFYAINNIIYEFVLICMKQTFKYIYNSSILMICYIYLIFSLKFKIQHIFIYTINSTNYVHLKNIMKTAN